MQSIQLAIVQAKKICQDKILCLALTPLKSNIGGH